MATALNTSIKRKNIDLPLDTCKKLSLLAAAQGRSLKAYIEKLLIAKADSVSIDIRENPSPNGDEWFEDPQNIISIEKGISQMKAGEGKVYTINEIREKLGV